MSTRTSIILALAAILLPFSCERLAAPLQSSKPWGPPLAHRFHALQRTCVAMAGMRGYDTPPHYGDSTGTSPP